jgi:hypothetical protein
LIINHYYDEIRIYPQGKHFLDSISWFQYHDGTF